MALRFSEYRFWLLCTALALGLLVACSSDNTSGNPGFSGSSGAGGSGGGGSGGDGATVADSMTKG